MDEAVTPVARPFGVSASAVVVILGSLFVIAVGVVMATIPAPPPGTANAPPISESAFRTFAVGTSIFLFGLGGFGIWTALGLFSLRPWARTSILVFAALMTAMCVISIIAVSIIPMPVPKGKSVETVRYLRPFMISMYALPTLIGAWWLVQFNRPATKAAFAASGPLSDPERPLSITVIAWLFLIAAPGSLIPILARMPLFVAGMLFTGLAAQLGYVLYSVISLYLGLGLLKREERARKLSLVYFALTGAHMVLVSSIPAWRTQMLSIQSSFAPSTPNVAPVESTQMLVFSILFALVFCGGGAWFLVRNKNAFTGT